MFEKEKYATYTHTHNKQTVSPQAREHDKVVQCLIQLGMVDRVMQYCQKMDHRADWIPILSNLVRRQPGGPEQATSMAIKLATNPGGALLDVGAAVDVFMQYNLLQNATKFLLEYLKPNREDDGPLQTKLLEMNLLGGAPQVADAIMQQKMLSHFDKNHIAGLCERCGLFQRAAEYYVSIEDVKRVILNTHQFNQEFLVQFLGQRKAEECLQCLQMLLQSNIRANLKVVVDVAKKYSEELRPENLIKLFETFQSQEGLFYYLGGIVNTSTDPDVHFKYIESAATLGKARHDRAMFQEVERICRDSKSYVVFQLRHQVTREHLSALLHRKQSISTTTTNR